MEEINIQNNNPHIITKGQITAIFEGKEYTSMVLELKDNNDETRTIQRLAEEGTNNSGIFKMPLAVNEFMVFSRFQLDQTLFRVKIWDEAIDATESVKRTRKSPGSPPSA